MSCQITLCLDSGRSLSGTHGRNWVAAPGFDGFRVLRFGEIQNQVENEIRNWKLIGVCRASVQSSLRGLAFQGLGIWGIGGVRWGCRSIERALGILQRSPFCSILVRGLLANGTYAEWLDGSW